MEFTGERVIPEQVDQDLFNEHMARYRFAETLVSGRRVLDAGCGLAYGSAALAERAAEIFALDNAPDALVEAQRRYGDKLRYAAGSCAALPFPDASFDIITAFEVIEHLEDWRGLIREAGRVLRPEGQFLVSTPNRLYYAESREAPNAFHVHEFEYEEFRGELEAVFPHATIFLENHVNAIAFRPPNMQGLRSVLEGEQPKPEESHFFLAVCSRSSQFGAPGFLFAPNSGNVLRERERHIDKLDDELVKKGEWLKQTSTELEEMTRIHRAEQEKAQAKIDELEADLSAKTEWARKMEEQFAERSAWAEKLEVELRQTIENYRKLEAEGDGEKRSAIEQLKTAIEKIDLAERTVVERTEWARSLDRELEAAREQLNQLYASPAYRWGRRLGLAPKPNEGAE